MIKVYKIDNVNGSEENISLITPFNPDEKDNFWVDDHPETKNFTIGYFLTESELAAELNEALEEFQYWTLHQPYKLGYDSLEKLTQIINAKHRG